MSIEIKSTITDLGTEYQLEMEAKKGVQTKTIGYRFKKPINIELVNDVEDVAQMTFRFLDKWNISLDKYWEYCKLNLGDDVTSSGSM